MRGLPLLIILILVPIIIIACISLHSSGVSLALVQSPPASTCGCATAGAAMARGRRPSQEDRLLCASNLPLPSLVNASHTSIGDLFGVFDGHLGDKASDFAAKTLYASFLHHITSLLSGVKSSIRLFLDVEEDSRQHYLERSTLVRTNKDVSNDEVIREALKYAMLDVDSSFTSIALKLGLEDGSTALAAIQLDGQVLVANVGDSKAFICSSCPYGMEKYNGDGYANYCTEQGHCGRRRVKRRRHSVRDNVGSAGWCAKELSEDHRPDRVDERARIEASGGFVTSGSSLFRVNGELAVSRAIGDVRFKKYGVTADPEISAWQKFTDDDHLLVLASDGIFEKMSPGDVCALLHAIDRKPEEAAVLGPFASWNSRTAGGEYWDLPQWPAMGSNPSSSSEIFGSILHSNDRDHIITNRNGSNTFQRHGSCTPQLMAQSVLEIAYELGSLDNLSVLIIPIRKVTQEDKLGTFI